jgi:hypothetical protein
MYELDGNSLMVRRVGVIPANWLTVGNLMMTEPFIFLLRYFFHVCSIPLRKERFHAVQFHYSALEFCSIYNKTLLTVVI